MVRPLRRSARVVVVLAILTVTALGFYARVNASSGEFARVMVSAGPDSTALLDGIGERGDMAAAGLRDGDRLVSLDGEPTVAVDSARLASGFPLSGQTGDTLAFVVERGGETIRADMIFGKQDVLDARSFGLSDRAVSRWLDVLFLVMILAFVVSGSVLFVRSRARGYLASLATALLAASGGLGFVAMANWDGADMARSLAIAVVITAGVIFVSAIPAVTSALVRFPDGRYLPRWTRHTKRISAGGLVLLLGSAAASDALDARWVIWFGIAAVMSVLAAPLVGLVQKYLRAEDSVVRQQMKWVLLPLGAFVLTVVSTLGSEVFPSLDADISPNAYLYSVVVGSLAGLTFAAIPLGVLAGVFQFRPWDADLWIARSAAIGIATLGLAAVFAAGAELMRLALRSSFGAGADPIAAALAAVLSLFAFNPVREWFTRRAERDLERTREILGERLPLVLAGRQVVASPGEIGRVAIRGLREALQTDRAAVIDLDPEGWEVVAASGVDPEVALAWADATLDARGQMEPTEQVWEDPTFVLRVPLHSAEDELVGVLALGTHGKGRGYSTEERKAVAGLARPLAEALRVAERREEAEAARNARLARLIERFLGDPS